MSMKPGAIREHAALIGVTFEDYLRHYASGKVYCAHHDRWHLARMFRRDRHTLTGYRLSCRYTRDVTGDPYATKVPEQATQLGIPRPWGGRALVLTEDEAAALHRAHQPSGHLPASTDYLPRPRP